MNHMEDRIQTVRPPPPRHVSTAGLEMVDPTDAEVQVSTTITHSLIHVQLMSALEPRRLFIRLPESSQLHTKSNRNLLAAHLAKFRFLNRYNSPTWSKEVVSAAIGPTSWREMLLLSQYATAVPVARRLVSMAALTPSSQLIR